MNYSAVVYVSTLQMFPLARFFYTIGIWGLWKIPLSHCVRKSRL